MSIPAKKLSLTVPYPMTSMSFDFVKYYLVEFFDLFKQISNPEMLIVFGFCSVASEFDFYINVLVDMNIYSTLTTPLKFMMILRC